MGHEKSVALAVEPIVLVNPSVTSRECCGKDSVVTLSTPIQGAESSERAGESGAMRGGKPRIRCDV